MLVAPKISVVIPAYNRAETIRPSIESVLWQTRNDFEIIVVDDCSTDGTADIVAGIDDPRIRLLYHEENRGAGAARNTGACHARGQWIAFQDSDDEWLPRKLEKQMIALEASSSTYIGAYCGMVIVNTYPDYSERTDIRYHPRVEFSNVNGELIPALLHHSLISTQTLVVRGDILNSIGGFDERLRALEDWECALRLAQRGRFILVDEPLVIQRFSKNSITRNHEQQRQMRMQIVEKHINIFSEFPEALSHRYYENAGQLRRQGALAEARSFLLKACRLKPSSSRYWAMLAYVTFIAPLRGQRSISSEK